MREFPKRKGEQIIFGGVQVQWIAWGIGILLMFNVVFFGVLYAIFLISNWRARRNK